VAAYPAGWLANDLLNQKGGYMQIMTGKWQGMLVLMALLILPLAFGQETSAGMQGTVKDTTGGLVVKAKVEVASPALIGTKKADTDQGGYYRFANLPPGV
jgi:hypothetical protein